MKIAQVAPLFESVPPSHYGGTERIVSYLTEALVREGHDVTLYASGDSRTSARLKPMCDRALRLGGQCADPVPHHMRMIEEVYRAAGDYDLIHFHIDYLHFPITRRSNCLTLTTMHGRLDHADTLSLYRSFREIPLVSISENQRGPLPWNNWVGTVYNGIPDDIHTFRPRGGDYLVFVGRLSRDKRPDRAIEIATRTGLPLKIAAKADTADQEYIDAIRPLLEQPHVEYLGEVSDLERDELVGNARALLFPIDWPEPFGLAMIEAMACGTPVVAWRCGAVPEVMEEGVTGYIVNSTDEAVEAVGAIDRIDRSACRHAFESRFTSARMAQEYTALYETLLGHPEWQPEAKGFVS